MEKDQPFLYHDGFSQPQSSANNEHDRTEIGVPLRLDAITIFSEAKTGAPFCAEERFTLTGKAENAWPEIWKLGVR